MIWLRFAPYIAIGVLALGLWGMHQRGKVLQIERDAALSQAHALEAVVTAHKALQKELAKLRADYEERERKLRAIPDDGCLDKRIPDDLRLLLAPNGEAANPGAGTKGGAADAR
jgi:hypothetical protein